MCICTRKHALKEYTLQKVALVHPTVVHNKMTHIGLTPITSELMYRTLARNHSICMSLEERCPARTCKVQVCQGQASMQLVLIECKTMKLAFTALK